MRGLDDSPTGAVASGDELSNSLSDTLRDAVERHGERLVLLCSFQKEESVLLDELLNIGKGHTPVRIATIDTGVLFPETLQTWKAFEERFGYRDGGSRREQSISARGAARALLLGGEGRCARTTL